MVSKAPGLKSRPRSDGTTAHYWVATAVVRDPGDFPHRTVRVHGTEEEIAARCRVLTSELRQWLSGHGKQGNKGFDGTLGSLIRVYQQTQESPYHKLKHNSRVMYDESLTLLETTVGARRLQMLTGLDFMRWYSKYREPAADTPKQAKRRAEALARGQVLPANPERIRRAYKAMQLLRIVIKFGVVMDLPECVRLATILENMEFESTPSRVETITYEQAKAICNRALRDGLVSIALAQAFQFELTLRQIDVIGRWEPVKDGETGGIVENGKRWVDGLLWSHLDADGVLNKQTTKIKGVVAEHDTMQYPFLRSIIDRVPARNRIGPVVVCENTGLPYKRRHFAETWREIATKVGIPAHVFNRDSRAGGITEGSDAGADLEHLRHHANHKNAQTTVKYNRRTLEKTRSVAQKRVSYRDQQNKQ